jgi:catechol 2,3-dioxygenase-like lactoylglutathione lyase family enzyme
MKRALAFLCGLCIAAAQAYADPKVDAVDRIIIPVSDLARASGFYTGALSFTPIDTTETPGITLRLGSETIELVRHVGRPLPRDSRSNDRWFQHLAIVVSDIDRAYATVLREGAAPISTGPQELPAWNPNAGGIRAVYFRDPDGHPLELIQFPRGKGDPRWQDRQRLFLGIDHSAIVVRDTDVSVAFYRDRLGLRIAATSENWGIEQERLSAVPGAHVRITALRAGSGPGVELLDYLMPRDGRPMPADTTADDLWAEEIVMRAAIVPHFAEWLLDPVGHAIGFVAEGKEASRRAPTVPCR